MTKGSLDYKKLLQNLDKGGVKVLTLQTDKV